MAAMCKAQGLISRGINSVLPRSHQAPAADALQHKSWWSQLPQQSEAMLDSWEREGHG